MKSARLRTRYLIVSCFDPGDRQFCGIRELCRRIDADPEARHVTWGSDIGPHMSGDLRWLLVTGHGAEMVARMSGGVRAAEPRDAGGFLPALEPRDLSMPADSHLYLLGCYQGKPGLKRQWAEGAGIPPSHVHGCPEETETALSTLFLLNLSVSGCGSAAAWFDRWLEVNRWFRPRFPELRDAYERSGRDFLAALDSLEDRIDFEPFADFIAAGREDPGCLNGLGSLGG